MRNHVEYVNFQMNEPDLFHHTDQYISIHMERRLLKMLQNNKEMERMVVRVKLISAEGKMILELGKYQQSE